MTMELGAFSLSLNVADIAASRAFYEKLGFHVAGGNQEENWLILRNGSTNIGLFQGMFERNMLTFTPGWDDQSQEVDPFTDIREIQQSLEAEGIEFVEKADTSTRGPAYFRLVDPDGNPILFDQYR